MLEGWLMCSCIIRSLSSKTSWIACIGETRCFSPPSSPHWSLHRLRPTTSFYSAWDGSRFLAAVVRIPPYAVLASGLPPAAAPYAARVLAQAGYEVTSISGLNANAVAFANAWHVATNATTKILFEEQRAAHQLDSAG